MKLMEWSYVYEALYNPDTLSRILHNFSGNFDMDDATKMEAKIAKRLKGDPVFFAKAVMSFFPFDYQTELLRTKAKRVAACWGRA